MRWRIVSLSAFSALLVAGCGGGGERLPVLMSLQLARLADRTGAGGDCGRPLLAAAIAAVNLAQVPAPLQERLLSDANRVASTCSRAAARDLAARLRDGRA
jgi:hypothetical protein